MRRFKKKSYVTSEGLGSPKRKGEGWFTAEMLETPRGWLGRACEFPVGVGWGGVTAGWRDFPGGHFSLVSGRGLRVLGVQLLSAPRSALRRSTRAHFHPLKPPDIVPCA